MKIKPFNPPPGLRNPHVQSLLNSLKQRKRLVSRRAAALLAAEQEWVMDGGVGDDGERVQLLAHYSAQPGTDRGTAVLLHGWEGSSRSNYLVSLGGRLFDEGFNVFRLNFRDHGQTHHMNPGIFHSCRLDEVIHALGDMQQRTGCERWMLAGYSLGGNFALRVARHGPERGLSIGHALAVCPVINPEHVLKAMETGPKFYERYYLAKWAKSVRAKQASYPERYNYEEWYDLSSLRARTEFFATRYYDFESLGAYLDGYSIAGTGLQGLSVDSTLLTSEDDPVCPVSDLEILCENPALDVQVTRYGGHCGYLKNWKLYSWADDMITQLFLQAAAPAENTVSE